MFSENKEEKEKRAKIIEEIKLNCNWCKHIWIPKTPNPVMCPRCKVALNRIPKIKKIKVKKLDVEIKKDKEDEINLISETDKDNIKEVDFV